jgi:hypothetical protein
MIAPFSLKPLFTAKHRGEKGDVFHSGTRSPVIYGDTFNMLTLRPPQGNTLLPSAQVMWLMTPTPVSNRLQFPEKIVALVPNKR